MKYNINHFTCSDENGDTRHASRNCSEMKDKQITGVYFMLERVGLLPWDIALIQTVDITDHWDTWRKYLSFHSNIEYILMLHKVRIMAGENCDKDVCVSSIY